MIRFTIDGEKHEFDGDKFSNLEAIALKRKTIEHWDVEQFEVAFKEFDPEAVTFLVWIALKREGQDLALGDVDFDLIEFSQSIEVDEETDDEPDPQVPAVEEIPSN